MASINITPFTDVLLVLLIIFIILSAIVTPPGFEKKLPNHSSASTPQKPDPRKNIDVEVNDKGVIFVDTVRTDDKGIYAVMAAAEKKKGVVHVSITADPKVQYQVIISILDAARLVGLEDVGFVTS